MTTKPVYAEIYEFLVSQPSREDIINFRTSETTQQRVREMLDAKQQKTLRPEQEYKLDHYQWLASSFMAGLKKYARKKPKT